MELYLSSYQIGDQENARKLAELFKDKKVALISNALDEFSDPERRNSSEKKQIDALKMLNNNISVEVVDLRNYFGRENELAEKLKEFEGFWVMGGNTFVLNRAYKLSGFDNWLSKNKNNPKYTYGGFSAGVCVLMKDLSLIAEIDNPNVNPYESEVNDKNVGVGFFDFVFIPHVNKDDNSHKETPLAKRLLEKCLLANLNVRSLADGEVIIIKFLTCKEISQTNHILINH